jgi:uncharacterized protein with PQ loop repeat
MELFDLVQKLYALVKALTMIDLLGFMGGLCFMISAIPLAYKTVKNKKTDTPWMTIFLVMSGSFIMSIYGYKLKALPLMLDMAITFSCWSTIASVKFLSERTKKKSYVSFKELNFKLRFNFKPKLLTQLNKEYLRCAKRSKLKVLGWIPFAWW